eukprot:4446006-Prymnesium_polylepis.1
MLDAKALAGSEVVEVVGRVALEIGGQVRPGRVDAAAVAVVLLAGRVVLPALGDIVYLAK